MSFITKMFKRFIRNAVLLQNCKYYSTIALSKEPRNGFPIEEIGNCIKIKPSRLEIALKKNKNLYQTNINQWKNCFNILITQGFKSETALNMVTNFPQLLYRKDQEILNGIENWRNCQFGERGVLYLLSNHPYFIDVPERTISTITSELLLLTSSRQKVKQIIELNPDVIYNNLDDTRQIISYVRNVMKIETPEIYKSKLFQLPFEELKCRHIFLTRLGLFKPRNPKASPLDPCTNPKLYQITDTDDVLFATKICTVTLEEFRVFQQLYKNYPDDNLYDSDDEEYYDSEINRI